MAYDNRSRKMLYEFYKNNGICVNCGQTKAEKNKVRCMTCLEKGADSQRRRREKIRKNEQT